MMLGAAAVVVAGLFRPDFGAYTALGAGHIRPAGPLRPPPCAPFAYALGRAGRVGGVALVGVPAVQREITRIPLGLVHWCDGSGPRIKLYSRPGEGRIP